MSYTWSEIFFADVDVGLFSPYQHYYGIEVDNYVRSGKNIIGIKKSVFLPFLTAARNQTFSSHNILQSFVTTGIWPLNAQRVLGKITPSTTKRRDTLGTMLVPKSSREIRQRVLSATKLVDTLSSQSSSLSTIDRVKSIMQDLGHQLEEEIAEKEIWQELTHKLQNVDLIHNTTDKRKLSAARVLDGAALIKLRDARLEKDTKKADAALARKAASGFPKSSRKASLPAAKPATTRPVRRRPSPINIPLPEASPEESTSPETIGNCHSGSEIEEISDKEWDPPTQSKLPANQNPTAPSTRQGKHTSQLLPDRPLYMALRSRSPKPQ